MLSLFFQHASSDVEKMVLGNKCDMEERRQVSKVKGEQVCIRSLNFYLAEVLFQGQVLIWLRSSR